MFIAQQKKKENIAEYLLYMWQLEDMLRACRLNIDEIYNRLVAPYDKTDEEKQQARKWYAQLMTRMTEEGIEKSGHLKMNDDILQELKELHNKILKQKLSAKYTETYYQALPAILDLQMKAKKDASEIETCFSALYGYMLLKLQQKEISTETQTAVTQISKLMALLSKYYHQNK